MDIKTYGARENPPLIFLHGWPDSASLWTNQVDYFSKNYFCLCITLPQFGENKDRGWGFDFPELSDLIALKVKELLPDSERKVVIIGHDWGAYLTYWLEQRNPDWVDRIITMDVGGDLDPKTLGHKMFFVSYQCYLLSAFLIGKLFPPLGNFLSRGLAKVALAPEAHKTRSEMNYLYFYFWRAVLCRRYRVSLLKGYKPRRPILYFYGCRKKYHFHSEEWIGLIQSRPECRVEPMKESDHWLMVREPKRTNEVLERWLS